MAIDPSYFYLYNIIDTCSIWNLLSSHILFSRSDEAGVHFYCTEFVVYEALYKKRTNPKECQLNLQKKFKQLLESSKFIKYSLSIEDLQEIEILNDRKKLGKGELSSLVFAKKTGQAFLSDDQKARKFAKKILPNHLCQTIPHLFSWLIFNSKISDSEKELIISEHKSNDGNIDRYFESAYQEGCRCRCLQAYSLNREKNDL